MLIDGIEFSEQETDQTIGRFPDGSVSLEFLVPTPNSTNGKLTNLAKELAQQVNIYPNPATQTFVIDLTNLNQLPQSLNIQNVLGQVILHQKSGITPTLTPNTTDWLPGIYFIQLDFGKAGVLTRKVIIE